MSSNNSNTKKLANKTALVTGGTSGIGFATAKLLLAEGAQLAITGTSDEKLAAAADELGAKVLLLKVDVRSSDDLQAAFAKVKQEFGKLDILFANAGIGGSPSSIADQPDDTFDAVLNTNVRGTFMTLKFAIPLLAEGGSVIFTGSIVGDTALPNLAIYAASKAAIRSFARTASAELLPNKVRVNVVTPGPIATPIFGKFGLPQDVSDGFRDSLAAKVPLKRLGEASEVGKAVLFLASDDSSFITGQEIVVDGGILGHGPLA